MKTSIYPILWGVLCCLFSISLSAQTNKPAYHMFETIYLHSNNEKLDAFEAGLKAHNKKYHNKAPHVANVWAVRTGPKSGAVVWMKGPLTFADLDAEDDEGHGQDWRDNVVKNCTDLSPTEYWKRRDDVSRTSTNPQNLVKVRFYKVNAKDRQGYRMGGLFKQMYETVKAMDGDFNWEVYENEFQQGDLGRHFAIVRGYDKWGDIDSAGAFKKAFEKIHGENSFQRFNREMGEVFIDGYDEIWSLIPSFSGTAN